MRLKFIASNIVVTLFLSGCSAPQEKIDSSRKTILTLDNVEGLIPGKTDYAEVIQKFGPPQQKIPHLEKTSSSETWIYPSSEGYQKASLIFDRGSHKLQSSLWVLQGDEPEVKMDNFKQKYPQTNFKKGLSLPTGPDVVGSYETNFTDDSIGMTILVNESKNEIVAIRWFDPDVVLNNKRLPTSR